MDYNDFLVVRIKSDNGVNGHGQGLVDAFVVPSWTLLVKRKQSRRFGLISKT